MFKSRTFSLALSLLAASSATTAFADQLATIKDKGVLVCGTIGTVPPFNFQDPTTRELTGYDIDLCKLIAKKLGVKTEVKIVAGAARIPELNRGTFDIITGSLGWTEERAKQVNYSYIDFESNQMIGVMAASSITSIDQLKDKRIAAQTASTSEKAVKEKMPEASVVTFQDVPQALLALKQGKVQGLALGELMLRSFIAQNPDIKIVPDSTLFVEKQAVGVRKGEDALLVQINQILKQAETDGELDKIFDHWLGKDSEFKMTRDFKVAPV